MKILHVGESIRGGCGTYLNETASLQIAELGSQNIRVLVPRQHVSHLTDIDPASVNVFHRPHRFTGLIFLSLKAARTLVTFRPDVIHLHSTFAGLVVRLLAPILAPIVAPKSFIVYCPHGWAFDVEMPRACSRSIEWVERWLALLTDKIVAISSYEYEAGKSIGIHPTKLKQILNGIGDGPRACPAEWTDTRLRVLFVGRMDRQKGFDILLQSVEDLKEKIAVRAIGAAIHSSGMHFAVLPNIEMLGWRTREEIAAQMLACDVVVVPSRWEGFGLVAIEAMRSGKAVIAANVGGLQSIVIDGVTGRLIPKGDARTLASVLTSQTAAEWAKMGRAGRERYLELYTTNRLHRQLMDMYREGIHVRDEGRGDQQRRNEACPATRSPPGPGSAI